MNVFLNHLVGEKTFLVNIFAKSLICFVYSMGLFECSPNGIMRCAKFQASIRLCKMIAATIGFLCFLDNIFLFGAQDIKYEASDNVRELVVSLPHMPNSHVNHTKPIKSEFNVF